MGKYLFALLIASLIAIQISVYSQPLRQWVAHYNGPANQNDVLTSMVIDDSGDIIVTGSSVGVGTGIDIATIKYDQDGAIKWINRYNGSGTGEDKGVKVVVDSAENVYVTGTTTGAGLDIVTIKYDRTGTQIWAMKYSGSGDDKPYSIDVDDSMNVYVTGSTYNITSGLDIITLKYNSSGVLIWSRIFNGSGNGNDFPIYLKLEGYNYCYVGGVTKGTDNDYLVIKYNSRTGDLVWTRNYDSQTNEILCAMRYKDADELYLTGTKTVGTNTDIWTLRVNAVTGDTVWTNTYNGSTTGNDVPTAISLHANSRVYITGKTIAFGSYYDLLILRLNQANGSLEYENHYNGTANDEDVGLAMIGGGSPMVVGSSFGINSARDIIFIEFQADLDINWVVRYNGIMSNNDIAYAIGAYKNYEYVAGVSTMKNGTTDYILIKYVPIDSMKYRTVAQGDLTTKGLSLKAYNSIGNFGNMRDSAFSRAFPKIKKGYAGAPGGMVLGLARPDSPNVCGWIRFMKGSALIGFLPNTGTPRGFDLAKGMNFLGELKNPKVEHHNNKLAGELAALKINIAASDAEITPMGFGDLIFDNGDTSYKYNGYTIRQIAQLVDNFLSYYRNYIGIDWARLDTILTKINNAFRGPYVQVSKSPLMLSGVALVDTISFLKKNALAKQVRLEFKPEMIDNTPEKFALYQNYPNPFNPTTNIEFNLPEDAIVTLKIYNILGQEIETLIDEEIYLSGRSIILFNASGYPSGIYFYKMYAKTLESETQRVYVDSKKMLLLK